MQPRLRYVLVLGALVFALAAGAFAEESNARIVRLSYVTGQVDLDRDGASGLDTAFLNMPLANGAQLVTGDDGFAEVEFESGTTIRLTPRGDLRFRHLGLQDGYMVSAIELVDGTAYFNVKHEGRDEFHVLLNGQELRVPKSSRFRVVVRPEGAQVSVLSGELRLMGDEETKIKKNETISLDFQDPARFQLSGAIETLAYDAWNQEREGYTGRYVSSGSYLGYSSGFSYGWNDLNFFGAFFSVPGYGSCWRPYGFGQSWDPYMDGAWVYYPGWGYTWVSGYPWGWAPYRYGRWVFVGGYGWVWQPGHRWNRWYAYSPVVNPPHDYHRHEPPQHRRPPIVAGGGTGGGTPRPGGPNDHRGPGGRRNDDDIVVVGSGPFNGRTGGGLGHTPTPSTGTGGQVATTGSGRPLPVAITPGVLPNRDAVIDQLRRVHGEDLGVRNVGARGRIAQGTTANTPGTGVTTTTDSTATTGATATTSGTTTTGGSTPTGGSATTGTGAQTGVQGGAGATSGTPGPRQQPQVVITPSRPQLGSGTGAGTSTGQVHPQPPAQPNANPAPGPQYHRPPPPPTQNATPPPSPSSNTSGSTSSTGSGYHGGGSTSTGSGSSGYHGGSSGSSSGGSSSSSGSHSSGSSSSSGHSNSSGSHGSGSKSSSDPK